MSMVEDALAFVDEEAIAQLTMEMVDIPSPTGGERALAEYLADRFRAAGLQTSIQEVEPDRYNVFGRIEGTGDGPTLMYCGHLTRPTAATRRAYATSVRGISRNPGARTNGSTAWAPTT